MYTMTMTINKTDSKVFLHPSKQSDTIYLIIQLIFNVTKVTHLSR